MNNYNNLLEITRDFTDISDFDDNDSFSTRIKEQGKANDYKLICFPDGVEEKDNIISKLENGNIKYFIGDTDYGDWYKLA